MSEPIKTLPGKPFPLGATWDGFGTNFAIYSEHATKVILCLFDSPGAEKESVRIQLPFRTHYVWHVYLPDIQPGQLYGYRVHGPYEPANGHRFNPRKLLLDPYAKCIGRDVKWSEELFGYTLGHADADLSRDERDSAAFAPLAAVVNPTFDWKNAAAPDTGWQDTLIYEAHIKGLTQLHPEVPEEHRGTYLGLCSPAVTRHLKRLGVTAVEIMPAHYHIDTRQERPNYWGYDTLGYLAPDPRFVAGGDPLAAVIQFKTMVRCLHAAGIEVILDVVYNHTAEGNQLGPTLSLRGVDNAHYYRLSSKDPRYYDDFSGCGNSLNMRHPAALRLVMDSLRYWVLEMHVDGFRFDLAAALARELESVDRLSTFFDIIHQDPVLSQVKLIAEPWDVGVGGYQVGNFPAGWAEWNGRYRDAMRRFWKGEGTAMGEMASRICGSSDLYGQGGRHPHASINFITSHDGFTLEDLVSYNGKHNEANLEDNRDGDNNNLSFNYGEEGATGNAVIQSIRWQQKRNFIASLFLSLGVPMLRGGDELSHTQRGNNNAYCQDNDISWLNWDLADSGKRTFLEFVVAMAQIWRSQQVFHRKTFFQGRKIRGSEIKDISWFAPNGEEMSDQTWDDPHTLCFGVRYAGDAGTDVDEYGDRVHGSTVVLIFNAHDNPIEFHVPAAVTGHYWECVLDTSDGGRQGKGFDSNNIYSMNARSTVLLVMKS